MTKRERVKILYLTFDYELFFKRAGSIENCLLKPTQAIMNSLGKTGTKATFFVDVLHLMRCEDFLGAKEQLKQVSDQICALIHEGHRVELHLHPHWLDAKFEGGNWIFPTYKHYRLQALDEAKVIRLFVEGTQYLESIAHGERSEYKVRVFRAGGYCIQPFSSLREGFRHAGIIADSSVAPGFFSLGDVHNFDFREAKFSQPYAFNQDPLQAVSGGEFMEFPITVLPRNLFRHVLKYVSRKLPGTRKFPIFGDGEGIPLSRAGKLFAMFDSVDLLSLDGLSDEQVFPQCLEPISTLISHPKMMTAASLRAMEMLCENSELCIGALPFKC